MRCPVCLLGVDPPDAACAVCGATMSGPRGRELTGVRYLLGQMTVWEAQGRVPEAVVAGLRRDYEKRREDLKAELLPRVEPPPPPVPPPPPPPAPALRAEPMAPVRPVRPVPPRPAFAWRDLCTERNVRWILNLGIFIFSVALAVFIHTQWKGMAPLTKAAILFGSSAAALVSGRLLRRTMLQATGTALLLLGAIAVPIDFMALLRFGLVDPSRASEVGLAGSIVSLALYVLLARIASERRFEVLAALAGLSTVAFTLRTAGVAWPLVVPWLAPAALAATWVRRSAVARTAALALAVSAPASLVLLLAGELQVRSHAGPVEVALVSAGIAVARSGRRGGSWLLVAILGAMFAVAAGGFDWSFRDCRWPLALLGLALGLGWLRGNAAFIAGGIAAASLSLLAAAPDTRAVAGVLALPGAFHLALGLVRRNDLHAGAGALLLGAALSSALQGWRVPTLAHPLGYALYGAGVVALSRFRAREALHLVGVLAAGAAMLLFAARYLEYYLPKPAPGGQAVQLLGAAIAAASALAFGQLSKQLRNRYVSDVTFGCLGFAYLLVLRWAHVPGKWLGLSLALFGVAYVLLEKRLSRWLQRPSLFTGVACTVGASTFAFLQWFFWEEYLQSSLTLLLVGAFYLAAAQKTPYRWLSHVGMYVAAAGWLVALRRLEVPPEMHAFLTFLPAGWTLLVAARRRDLHLGIAALTVATGALAFVYLDSTMYLRPNLPVTIATSAAAAALAGSFAFRRDEVPGVDVRWASGLMAAFASTGYTLLLDYYSTGSPWGGFALFAMTAALGGASEVLRRTGRARQGWPLAVVGLAFTLVALASGWTSGRAEGVHLWVHGLGLALFVGLGQSWRKEAFSWGGALLGAAGLFAWLYRWPDSDWIGAWTFLLAGLALQRRDRPLAALGWLAAVVCPIHAALRVHEVPAAGLVFLAMTVALAFTRLHGVSYLTMLLAAVVSYGHPPYGTIVLFSGFALYLGLALARRQPAVIGVSLLLALAGDFSLATRYPEHAGLVALPLAGVLLAMAWEVRKKFGSPFAVPVLAASFAAAFMASAFAIGHPDDRVWVFLGDSLLFGGAAALFRRPELVYPCSAALVALDLSLMSRFGLGSTQTAFQLLTLALAKVLFVRSMGDKVKAYLQPVFVAALLVAAGVLVFGISRAEEYTGRDIDWAIWGMIVLALISGVAGRIRKLPVFVYLAAAHLLGAYYLSLHKYGVETAEFYTVPIGIGLVAWSVLATPDKGARLAAEVLAVAVLFLPSAVPSFAGDGRWHALAALGFAFGTVLAGMGLRRRVLVFGGTGAFVAEVLGQALRFLIEQHLSVAEWGMIVGGVMILIAALFESRKVAFVKGPLESIRAEAGKVLSTLE